MKLTRIALVAALAAVVAGCGKSPKAPQNTVAAVYVDASKAIDSIEDIAYDVASALPSSQKDLRDLIKDQIKEAKEQAKKEGVAIDSFKWAMATVAIDPKMPQPEIGVAVYVSDADTLKEKFLKDVKPAGKIGDVEYYELPVVPQLSMVAFVGKVIVAADSKDALEPLVKVYTGAEKPQPGFDDITKLEGNTVARVLIPEAGALVERFHMTDMVKTFVEKTGDEDLFETITEFGDLQLDVYLDDSDFGGQLAITAANRRDAKTIEALFTLISSSARFAADAAMVGASSFGGDKEIARTALALRKLLADDTIEADRSGRTATLTIRVDTDDVIEAAVKANFGE